MPLSRNAISNVVQMLFGAIVVFVLYIYINNQLGVEQLGVWSVVLATTSATRLADLGLGGSVTRFIARELARDETERAREIIDTAAITLIVATGVLLPLLYPMMVNVLDLVFFGEHLGIARELLPYAFVSLWLNILAAVYQGGLDGCQRMDLRAAIVSCGQVLLLVLAFVLVPRYGLVGLGVAQVANGVVLLVAGTLTLTRIVPTLSSIPRRWRARTLREMLGYGVNLQATSILMILFDPMAKLLMARYGGAAAAGIFEVANQVVLRVRGMIVAANQAIIPRVAYLTETQPELLATFYKRNVSLLVLATLPLFALVFAWGAGLCSLLIGSHEREFVTVLGMLTLGWAANTFAGPAFFTNMGRGCVGWNVLASATMSVLSGVLGWLLGIRYGMYGVTVAYVTGLIGGSTLLIVAYQRRSGLAWRESVSPEHRGIVGAFLTVVAIGWAWPLHPGAEDVIQTAVRMVVPAVIMGWAVWVHPLRHECRNWLVNTREISQCS